MSAKKIEKLLRWVVYGTFLTSLISFPGLFIYPFAFPKAIFVNVLIEVAAGLYGLLLIINWPQYRPKLTPITIALVAFLASALISSIFGVDMGRSISDTWGRMLGLSAIAHFTIFFFIIQSVIRSPVEWRQLFRISLLPGLMAVLLGLVQLIFPFFLGNNASSRVGGTFGSALPYGSFCLALFFSALFIAVNEKNRKWQSLAIIVILCAILGIIVSGDRTVAVAFFTGVAFVLVYWFRTGKLLFLLRSKSSKFVFVVFLTVLVSFIGISKIISKSYFDRILSLTKIEVTTSARWYVWQSALVAWQEKPVFGWGVSNFVYAFDKYFNPHILEFGHDEANFDNAHNTLINILTEQGIVGLFAYLSIFLTTLVMVWKARHNKEISNFALVIVVAYLIAHFIENLTMFETTVSYFYFILWLAFVNSLTSKQTTTDEHHVHRAERSIGLFTVFGVGGAVIIGLFINWGAIKLNSQTLSIANHLRENPEVAFTTLQAALGQDGPHTNEMRLELANSIIDLLNNENVPLSQDTVRSFSSITEKALQKNMNDRPLDISNHKTYYALSEAVYGYLQEADWLKRAKEVLSLAIVLAPNRQEIAYNLATIDLQLGDAGLAIKQLRTALVTNPAVAEGYWRLALAYLADGQNKEAGKILQFAQQNGIKYAISDQDVVNQIQAKIRQNSTGISK